MRRPRFRVRRMLLGVAVIGLGMGAAVAVERRAEFCQARAREHRLAIGCGTVFGFLELDSPTYRHKAMIRHYEDAAWRIWSPLPADPPIREMAGTTTSPDLMTGLLRDVLPEAPALRFLLPSQ